MMGQRIRYSHINNIAGVMTTWRKSEHGNIIDQSLKRNNVFSEGQQAFPVRMQRGHVLQNASNRKAFQLKVQGFLNIIRANLNS